MQFKKWIQLAVAAFALSALLASTANAQTPCEGGAPCNGCLVATLVFTDSENSQVPAWTKDLEVPAFDVTLGSLAKVDFTATAPSGGFFMVENLDTNQGCVGGTWSLDSLLSLTLVQGGMDIFNLVPLSVTANFGPLAPFDGTLDYRGPSGETTSFMETFTFDECFDKPQVLDDFRSDISGNTLTFTARTTQVIQDQNSNCGFLAIIHKLNVGLQLAVTYTYCPNEPPIAAPDEASTCAGTPVDIDVLANDLDPDGAIDCGSLFIASQPQNGVATISPACSGLAPCPGCVVTYLPDPLFTGTDTFTYGVLDNEGCPSGIATVTVQVRSSPIAAPDQAFTCQGQSVQIPVLANDMDPGGKLDCSSLEIVKPPSNGTVQIGLGCTGTGDCDSCLLTYTPNPGFFGTDEFAYVIGNTIGCVSAPALVLIEISANPIAANDFATTCQGVPVAIDVLANDTDPDGVIDCGSIIITNQPANGSVTISPNCTGPYPCAGCVVTYTPNPGFTGNDLFRYRVRDNDGCLSNTALVTVTVGANPIAANDQASTCEGVPVGIAVLANDFDPDGALDCGSIIITSNPANGMVQIGPGCTGTAPCPGCQVVYTPNPGFNGQDSFQYTVGDTLGCRSNPALVTVDVSARPVAIDDQALTCEGESVQIPVLQNDFDPDGTLDCGSIMITMQPSTGTVSIGLGCSGAAPCPICFLVYTPEPGQTGMVSFQYTVADLQGCVSAPATVTVDISANPIAAPDSAATCQGVPVDIPILANDIDPDGQIDCATIEIVGGPSNGSVTIGGGCTGLGCMGCVVTYSPTANFFGIDQFTYRVRDNRGCLSNQATVSIAVNGNPIAAPDTALTCQGQRVHIPILANDIDPDGTINCSSISIVVPPQNGTWVISGCTGPAPCPGCVVIYTPNAGFFGTDQFQYTVSDTQGCTSNPALVEIEVDGNPVGVKDTAFTCQDSPVDIDVLANDFDPNGPLDCSSIVIVNMPFNGSVTIGAGCTGNSPCLGCVVTYTPNFGYVGDDIFRYTVADPSGCRSLPTPVYVTVQTQPMVADDMAVTCQNECVTIDVLANDSPGVDPNTIEIVSGPSFGTIQGIDRTTGAITYCPDPSFCGGEDSFTYRIVGNAQCPSEEAVVRIAVSCNPFANDDFALKDEGDMSPILINILANDGDSDGSLVPSSVMIVAGPSHGDILGIDPLTGVVTYQCDATFVDSDQFTYSVLDDQGCPATATVYITLQLDCPQTAHRRQPGSLLLYPEFDNRTGVVTIVTVTNTKVGTGEGVQVHFVYRDKDDCAEFDRSEMLTPNDTLTLLTNFHNPNDEQGYLYVYTRCKTGQAPIAYNFLIGNLLVVDGVDAFAYSVNPVSFKGLGQQPSTFCPGYLLTDVDLDGVRDLDGIEYEQAPDEILIPRFLGQTASIKSELILIGLSGGPLFTTMIDFLIYDDNENAYSSSWTFSCWDRVPLLGISGVFSNSFLQAQPGTNPDEMLGEPNQETGWMRLDGNVAQSTTTVIQDPAFYAVLVECVSDGRCVADLPFERCTQDNGGLLPGGLNGGT